MIIFVAGVFGVGKTTFCESLAAKLGYLPASASALIRKYRGNMNWNGLKETRDISQNQNLLLDAVRDLQQARHDIVLDGHFVLLDDKGLIEKISESVFRGLDLDAILLIEEDPVVIVERLNVRDGSKWTASKVAMLMDAEKQHAYEFHRQSQTPIITISSNDIKKAADFVLEISNSEH